MKKLSQTIETTVFMTVKYDSGFSVEYVRNPFGEWCEPIAQNASFGGDNLRRVNADLYRKLEELYTNENTHA